MRTFLSVFLACISLSLAAQKQSYKFNLTQNKAPFFFSVQVPDGNYRVKMTIGSPDEEGETTVRAESRRLFLENIKTKKGEFVTYTFTLNKRNKYIYDEAGNIIDSVKLKKREFSKLNWDDYLTFEFNGTAPAVTEMEIERIDDAITVFLCGNSTVVDQDNEPWGSWGQMIPAFFNDKVCIANYAESGESSNTFIAAKRLKKALTFMKPGDYIFVEFGHNDEKQKGNDKGPYKHFTKSLKQYIDEARKRGAHPVLVTPTQRRHFDEKGVLKHTHGEYPQAVKDLAKKEGVPVIDLTEMTTYLYYALGVEGSKKALVHYSAGTFEGQTVDFADDTHFNPYGAYQIAKCVIEGIIKNNIPLKNYLKESYEPYDPKKPDSIDDFHWPLSPFTEIEKPDGN